MTKRIVDGAGTVPGGGVPMVAIGSRRTVKRVEREQMVTGYHA